MLSKCRASVVNGGSGLGPYLMFNAGLGVRGGEKGQDVYAPLHACTAIETCRAPQ